MKSKYVWDSQIGEPISGITQANPKDLAKRGISYLENAILGVFLEFPRQGDHYVSKADIERKLGIHHRWKNFQFLCASILYKLEGEQRVEPLMKNGRRVGWRLTEAGYRRLIEKTQNKRQIKEKK